MAYDPEDPRCARLTLTGKMVEVSPEELAFAKEAMFSRCLGLNKSLVVGISTDHSQIKDGERINVSHLTLYVLLFFVDILSWQSGP